MTANRLLQLSGIVVDLLYQVEAVPAAGDEAIVRDFDMATGGGFNAMIAAKRAGMEVVYGGSVGTGPFADIVMSDLGSNDIAALRPRIISKDQGCCSVLIDRQGERTFIASAGAEGIVTDADMQRIDPARYGWCLLSGYALSYEGSQPALTRWLRQASAINALVFDPSPIVASMPAGAIEAALARATWISANTNEASCLTSCQDPALSAKWLAAKTPVGGGALVRDGANGCFVALSGGDAVHIAGISVDAIDTNGAGDIHTGSFIAGLAHAMQPAEASRVAFDQLAA